MAIKITNDCINCGACEVKCPNKAIYEGGVEWSFSYGSDNSKFKKLDGSVVGSEEKQAPISQSVYYIAPEKCTECVGFHDEPQCISVCPVDCCVPDENNIESREELAVKKQSIKIA
ncbi:MAG: 4Fe-4S dicluster domain-containing protein [Bacteroidia bacterium]